MARQKRLLILNGSHSDIPLIQSAKRLGFYVITSGNNPRLIGHCYSDEQRFADFSDPDAVLDVAKQLRVDAVCSCANDFGIISASYICEKLHLPGHDAYETTRILHQKDLFKKFALDHDIPTPFAESFNRQEDAVAALGKRRFPLIVKPVDLSGGKGVSVVCAPEDGEAAVRLSFTSSRAKRIVMEDYVSGTQHSFSTFIVNGRVVFYFSDNEYSYLNPFLVSTSAAPAVNVGDVAGELIRVTEKMASLLSLKDGIFHIQYIYQNRQAHILEITRRCSGDLYPYPVDRATGLDWAGWIVKAEAGQDCSDFPGVEQKGYCGRHCIMAPRNGTIRQIVIDPRIEANIYDRLIWSGRGDRINNYLEDKTGIVMLKYNSMDEMLEKSAQLHQLIHIEII